MFDAMTYDERQAADAEWLACQVRIVELHAACDEMSEDKDTAESSVLMLSELLGDVEELLEELTTLTDPSTVLYLPDDVIKRCKAMIQTIHNAAP